jgi:hypothetical protein
MPTRRDIMNEREIEEMHKNQETIARALEIAIALTKADDTWIRLDKNKDVVMDEPLFSTMKVVVRILNDNVLLAVAGEPPKVLSGNNRREDKK